MHECTHSSSATVYMTSELLHKFLDKNASMFTMLGFREQCCLDTICPKMLQAHSDDAFEAQMHKYFFVSLALAGETLPHVPSTIQRVPIRIWLCCFLISYYFLLYCLPWSISDAVLVDCLAFFSQLPSFFLFAVGSVSSEVPSVSKLVFYLMTGFSYSIPSSISLSTTISKLTLSKYLVIKHAWIKKLAMPRSSLRSESEYCSPCNQECYSVYIALSAWCHLKCLLTPLS